MTRGIEAVKERALAHPLVTVFLIALPSAFLSALDIWTRRIGGTYDADEAGYLAASLRMQRAVDFSHPMALVHEFFNNRTGPLVPLASVVPLVLGPRDPRSAMLIQPVLLVVIGVATAGIVRYVATPGWAILSGAFIVVLPSMIWSTESYWFGLGAAAAMAVALWSLLASDGLLDRRRWAFGAAIAAMVLARTMAIAFLPALVVAVLVLAWGDRRRLRGALEAALLVLVLAGPWFVVRRHEVFGYLFQYGYTDRAARFGGGNPVERLVGRVGELSYQTFNVLLLIAVPALVVQVVRFRWGSFSTWSLHRKRVAALAVVVVGGVVALASSSNHGVWFDLPLYAPVLALGVVACARTSALTARLLAVAMMIVAVLAPVGVRYLYVDHITFGASRYDARFTGHPDDESWKAAREWAAFDERVAGRLAELTGRGETGEVVLTGNTFLVNTNTLGLAAELDGWPLVPLVPDTTKSRATWQEQLQPRSRIWRHGRPLDRVIVVLDHGDLPFPPDAKWKAFERAAIAAGWTPEERIAFPSADPGQVVIYRAPR